ncbi:16350_t:CDS:2, partial [Gigaspora rosea]
MKETMKLQKKEMSNTDNNDATLLQKLTLKSMMHSRITMPHFNTE